MQSWKCKSISIRKSLKPGSHGVFFLAIQWLQQWWSKLLLLVSTFLSKRQHLEKQKRKPWHWSREQQRANESWACRHAILCEAQLVKHVDTVAHFPCLGCSKTHWRAIVFWLHTIVWACGDWNWLIETGFRRAGNAAREQCSSAVPCRSSSDTSVGVWHVAWHRIKKHLMQATSVSLSLATASSVHCNTKAFLMMSS